MQQENSKNPHSELVSYARSIADAAGLKTVAISMRNVSDNKLKNLGKFGASKVLNVSKPKFAAYNNESFASAISEAASKESAQVVIIRIRFRAKVLRLGCRKTECRFCGCCGFAARYFKWFRCSHKRLFG